MATGHVTAATCRLAQRGVGHNSSWPVVINVTVWQAVSLTAARHGLFLLNRVINPATDSQLIGSEI